MVRRRKSEPAFTLLSMKHLSVFSNVFHTVLFTGICFSEGLGIQSLLQSLPGFDLHINYFKYLRMHQLFILLSLTSLSMHNRLLCFVFFFIRKEDTSRSFFPPCACLCAPECLCRFFVCLFFVFCFFLMGFIFCHSKT